MKSYDQPRQHIKKQRHYFANNDPASQSYGFSNSHVWIWELDYKEYGTLKNWCVWTVVLEKTFKSPLDCKEIQPVHSEGDQPWDFFGIRSDQISHSVVSNSLRPMNRSTPGFPVHHQLAEFTQTHVHRVSDAIQPSHPLSSPSPPAPNPSQHQSLFQWVNSSYEMAKVLEFQL